MKFTDTLTRVSGWHFSLEGLFGHGGQGVFSGGDLLYCGYPRPGVLDRHSFAARVRGVCVSRRIKPGTLEAKPETWLWVTLSVTVSLKMET